MKLLRLLLCCLFSLALPAIHVRAQAPDAQAMQADVTARLTEFYTFYCQALETNDSLLAKPAKLKPYVSARFLKELARLSKIEGGIEADPFVCAQDSDPAWAKNIQVAHVKAAADGKAASADVTLGGQKEMVRHLRVSLVNEAGVYKVDKVKDADL